jgi:signal transduction histidine kinase
LTTLSQQENNLISENSQLSFQNHQVMKYLAVLQEECDRELKLIEDILSLQHLEAGTYSQQLTKINLQGLILHIIEWGDCC